MNFNQIFARVYANDPQYQDHCLMEPSSCGLTVAEHIQELIQAFPVMIFAKSSCSYCKKVNAIFSKYELGGNYYVLELDQIPSQANNYLDELEKLTGAKTVPRVFIGTKFIGGGNEIAALEKQGKLGPLLKDANAILY